MTELAQAANTAAAAGLFADHNAQRADNTTRAQRADLELFSMFLVSAGETSRSASALHTDPAAWRGVSWGIVAGFVRWMQRNEYADSSTARALATVKRFAKLAFAAGAIDQVDHALIATVTAPKGKAAAQVDQQRAAVGISTRRSTKRTGGESTKRSDSTPITAEQRTSLLTQPDTAQGRRDAVIMALLIDHGLRVSEIADLQVTNIDTAGGKLRFYRRKVDAWQTHAMTTASRAALLAWMQTDAPAIGPLLRGSRKDGSLSATAGMTTRSIGVRVAELAARAGIEQRVSPHDLRHDWATCAAAAGTDAFALRDAGGWASLTMPSRYVAAAAVANERVKLGR